MRDNNWINDRLKDYLEQDKYKNYHNLINFLIENDSAYKAKVELVCMFMNMQTNKYEIENLENALINLYAEDIDIDSYLNRIVDFNPKLGYVEITSSSGQDMKNNGNIGIKLPVEYNNNVDIYFENANKIMNNIKEVLKMILVDSKNVPIN